MERQVFVSHAADDPDWPKEAIEAVASAIREAGIAVRLDLWHQRDMKRHLSLGEWRAWMDTAIGDASHILCLVSPRYQRLWERRPEDAGGFGVAFESIRLVHGLYLQKQRSHGRILTLRPDGSGFDGIPFDLALDCATYAWAADRAMLLSHLGEAELPPMGVVARPSGPTAAAPVAIVAPSVATLPAITPAPRPMQADASSTQSRPSWASASGQDAYGRWADLNVNGVTQRMRWIPPTGPEGFWMGSPQAERDAIQGTAAREWANKSEHVPRRERVASGFWLADTPCTQAFWRAVADVDPSHFGVGPEAPERPVDSVSWDSVMTQFIAVLGGLPMWSSGARPGLPTEVEWEYAARAGSRTAYWWGDAWDDAKGNADATGRRTSDDQEGTTTVKRHAPNSWGLYDMHGNVWEWCADAWRERLDAPEARPNEEARVVRGGSWFSDPDRARAASRDWGHRGYAFRFYGFRFALRSPDGPEARGGTGR